MYLIRIIDLQKEGQGHDDFLAENWHAKILCEWAYLCQNDASSSNCVHKSFPDSRSHDIEPVDTITAFSLAFVAGLQQNTILKPDRRCF